MLKEYQSHFFSPLSAATAGLAVNKIGLSPQLPSEELLHYACCTVKSVLYSMNRCDKCIQLKYRVTKLLRHAHLSDTQWCLETNTTSAVTYWKYVYILMSTLVCLSAASCNGVEKFFSCVSVWLCLLCDVSTNLFQHRQVHPGMSPACRAPAPNLTNAVVVECRWILAAMSEILTGRQHIIFGFGVRF